MSKQNDSGNEVKRHPLAIAWDEWLATDEGQSCANIYTVSRVNPQYLENRLHRAFDAGVKAQEANEHSLGDL